MTIDLLKEMPQITEEIGLDVAELPHPSTVCKAFDRIETVEGEPAAIRRAAFHA